ncbi:MAG: S9 family peptidase [Candidatus Marinimicrobia bacterium]|mgnify:FL=1|nr:S9 family peptidase [Candidatus Neomarinimicrobiota bacterium]
MKNLFLPLTILLSACMQNSTPPNATKKTHEMTIHGDTRVDDYYWMRLTDEQKSAKDKDSQTQEVLDYINAENAYTQKRLKHTEKFQNDLFDEIVGRIKKDDESVPYLDNGYYYYTRYEKGKEYAIHCRKKGSLDGDEEVIMDENELAEGFDYFAIGSMSVSPDNQWLAFGVDTLSRRFYEINFKNLNTGDILQQTIENTTGGVAWANDNETVFYTSKNKVTLLSEKIYRHKVGSDYKNDALVYTEDDESYYIGVSRSKSGEYIIIYNSSTLVSDYHILRADNPEGDFKNFSPRGAAHEYGIDHYKDKFYIITNWEAKNNRLMETSEDATDMGNWKEVIAHRNDVHLLGLEIFNNHLVISERKDGLRGLRVMNQKTGSDEYINFGEQTYTARISVNEEFNTNILRYGYTSMVTPSSTYDYNMDTGEITLMKQQEVVGGYDQSLYRSERHYAPGRDGQPVPISLVYKKDLKNDPTFNNQGAPDNPQNLLLYAYGSYGSTRDPYFSSTRLSLLDRGFIYAIAHVRGSQIYGRQSYDDGKMLNKKNTFTDFIDAGKYLVKEGLTDSNHLFAEGGSAGGLLIGAVVNMAPELWKGTIAAVPFVDVVTTMLDASIPLTSNEWDEWGNPEEKKYYDYMLSYSPYDQVEDQIYPNILVTSGFFDSQVQYWEPLKWMAKLRDHWQGENNLYLHMNMDAGHGGKSGRFRRYREVALEYAFLFDLAGIKD